MNRGQMFNQMMFVHKPVSANLASKLWQFPALHALVFKQRLLPFVRFSASLAEKSRFVRSLCAIRPLSRFRSLSPMTRSLPHRSCKIMQANGNRYVKTKKDTIAGMASIIRLRVSLISCENANPTGYSFNGTCGFFAGS